MQSFPALCSNMPKLKPLLAHSPQDIGVLIHVPSARVVVVVSQQN
jgi:hypothetical protein